MLNLRETARDTRSWACYDCGKCTATCPVSRSGARYSPRRHVLAASGNDRKGVLENGTLGNCLTCKLCDARCPSRVGYTDLVRRLREMTHVEGVEPECPHGGALQSLMRMMARGGTQQDRLAWIQGEARFEREQAEVFFWTGCTMYYDAFFPEFGVATLNGTRASLRLLNRLDIAPVISSEERCCGHDLLWNGDRSGFESLARHNVKLVESSGASLLVTPCAECCMTWRRDYEPFFAKKPPKVVHMAELLADNLARLGLSEGTERRVTFQDPCRLGRHLGVYDAPRQVLQALKGVSLSEMPKSREGAICCAGGTWSHCDRFAKSIQTARLREARSTGAEILVTACPKCQIHFHCAMKDPVREAEIAIRVQDLSEIVAEALG